TFWPSTSPIRAATMRPSTSVGPPAANGMIMVSGRVGKSCAPAGPAILASAARSAPNTTLRMGNSLLIRDLSGDALGHAARRVKARLAAFLQAAYERTHARVAATARSHFDPCSLGGAMSVTRVGIAGLGAIGRVLAQRLA